MAVYNNANTTKRRKKLEKEEKTKVRAPAKAEKSTTKQNTKTPQREQTQTRSDLPTVVPWDAKTGNTRKIYDEMHGGAEKYMGTVVRNALSGVLKPGSAYDQAERQMQNAQARQQFYADLANAGVKHGDDKTFFSAASAYDQYQDKYNRTYDNYVRALQTEQERYGRRAKDAAREYEQSSQTNAAYYKDKVNYAVTQGDYKAAMDWMEKMTNAPLTPAERQKATDFIDLRYRYDPLVREQQEAEQILRNPYSTTEQQLAAQQRLNAATERANSDPAYYQFRQSADYYKTQNAMTAFRQKGADDLKRAFGNAGHGAQMDSYLRSQNAMLLLQQLYDALQAEGNTDREGMFGSRAIEATKEELRRYGVELGDLDESNFRTKLEQAMTEQGGKVKAMRAVLGQEGYDTDAIYENLNYERQLKDYQANQAAIAAWGKNAGFGDKLAATIASIPYSVYAKPIEGINALLGMVGSGSVNDPNNYRPVAPQSSMADLLRSGVTENMSSVGKFAYGVVTSALDSALNAFSFGGHLGLATMGLSAANTRANEILQKGGNAQQAFSGGLASGVIEALTEIVSIENLIDFAQNTGSLRQLAKNVGLQMFTEGSEEIAGEVLDIIADASIMGNLSDNSQAVLTYVAQGMTLAEAKREVLKDNALQILESGAAGALSGGLSGGLASGAGYLSNRMQQRADERRLLNTFYEAIGESVRDEDGLAEDLGAYAAEKGLKFSAGQVQEAPKAQEENQSLRQRERQIQQQQRTEQKNQKANTKLGKSADEALTKLGEEFRGKTVAASEARYTELTNKYKSDAFREQAQEAVKSSAAERYSGAKDLQTLEELHKDNVKGVKNKELLQAAEAAYRDKVYDLSTSRDEAARARQGARYANRAGEDINLTASYKADGQEVTSQVKRISEQKGQVVLENGTEANIQDLEMDADTKDLLTRLSQSVQGEAANTVLAMVRDAMRGGTVVDGYRTMANAISVYDQGRVGNVTRQQALSRTGLDVDLAGRLYDLGSKTGQEAVRDAQAEVDRQRTVAKKKGATGRRGSVDLSQIDTKSLDARQRLQVALATKIAEAVGVDVEFFASEAKGGRYQGEQGAYEVGKGKIRLDINAGRNYVQSIESGVLRTMSHELTHFIQDYSPEMYSELKTFAMKTLTDKLGDEGLEDLIQSKIDRESDLSRLDAEDEVIADACEMMLKDSSVIRELYEQNPDLAYKIREWLTRFLKRISEAFGGPMSVEARALRDNFAEMQRLWDQGLKDAAAAHQDIGELTDANYDRHATRSLLTATGFRVELEGQQVVAYDQDGNRVTEVTTDHVKNSGYGNLIKYAYQSGTISRKDMNKQIEGLAELMNTILKAQDGPMVWAYSGAMMFSAIKSNSDGQYTTTVDFTTVCRKTVEMVKAMSHTMKKLGRGLTIDEITQLQDKVLHTTVTVNGKEEGGIVNCPVCYVFSRWAGIGKILDNMKTFQEKYKDSKYDDVETLNKAIADLKKAAKIEKLSDLRKILPELDDEYEKLGNENLQLKEDLDKARKERNRVKARKSSTAEEKAAAVQKVNEINNQIKQNKTRMGVIESSLAPELSWLTTVRAYQDPNNKDRYLPNLDFMKNGYVPEDVLFDLDKGDVFAGTYTEAWKYRTGRGPSAGKAIVPYSDMRLGDLILGPGNNSAEGNNTFYEVSNEFTEKQQDAIIKAVQRMKAQNLIGGQRFQSTSDFRYEYGLDYLQSFLELQAIGGKMQTYTKIVEYAEMVASMGGDVNLSVMGLGSGLDENGILIYSSVTGIDPEAAKLITHKFDSAQTILVGINDAHIRAALDDTEIGDGGHGGLEVGFVIPYHASGASITKFIAKLVANLGEKWDRSNYRDYSDVQTDSVKTYPGMEGTKKADVEAATAALVNAMIVNPTNPTFKRSLTAEQKDWVRRSLLREVRNSILTRTAPAAFVKNNGETDEDAARRFIESCRSLFEGTSEDIINRSFDELRSIERRAIQGDKDAIAEYESWSAGVMFDLYNKMWMDSSRDDTYGVKLSSEQAKTIMPHEYWNRDTIRYRFDKDGKVIKDSGNAYVNGFIFRSYCYALGLNPRFTGITTKNEVLRTAKNKKTGELGTPYGDFSDERGYWKTLIDRAMYDNQGQYRDQNAINVTKLSDGSMLKPEYGKAKYGDLMVQKPREDRAIKAANAFVEDVRKKEGKVKHSLRPVEAVEPKTNGWQRSATFDEVKAEHPTLFELAAEEADTRNPTQIKGTVRTYRKIYDKLKAEGFDGTILDASSGLGVGTEAGRNEYDFDVDDIEPFPDASYKPRYTDYSKLNKTYDVVISNAVLNVIPQDLRDAMVVKIGELLNPGGRAFINVRGDDVKNAKTKVAINEDGMEYFISDSGSYQKGFTPTELKAYLEDALGDGFTVQLDKSFGRVSAVVTKDGAKNTAREGGKVQHSQRDDLQLADDEILMRMKESDVENPEQRKLLQEYQKLLREKEQIHDMLQQVKSVEDMLSGGALDENKAMQKDLQKRINKLNKRITEKLNIPLVKSLLTVERERVYKEGREKIGEIRENRKRQELRGRIKNLKDDLTKRMLKPSEQRFVPAELAKSMVAVLEAVDDSPAAGTKAAQKHAELGQRIRELSDAFADLAANNDPTFQTEYNEEFAGELREIAKATQGRNLRDLTSDELQDVYDAVKTVRDKMRTATKLLNRDSTKNIYENANDIALQQAALKKYNAMSKAERSEVYRRLHHISAMRAVEYMAGSDRSSTLYQMMADVEQGVTDAMTYVMHYNKRFDHLKTGANERVWRKAMTEQKSYGLTDEDGKDTKLTRMQVMQLIMTWRREMANKDLTHLQKGGAVIRDAKAMLNGKTPTSQIIHPTASQMMQLENSLTAWERDYIDQVSDYFKNVEAKEMGRVVYKLQHRALKTEAAYVPYIVDSAYLESKLESAEQVNNLWIKTPGSTNELKKMAPHPVIIDGLETVMKKHVSDSANYVNLALPIRDFSKVYNAMFADVNGTPYMPHTLIEENFGKEGDKVIRNALMEVQGVRGGNTWTTQIDEHLSMLQSAFVKSALLINPSVTIKQAASYLAAGSVLSRAALELGNRPILSKTDASHSPTLIMQLFANPMSKTAQRLWDEIDSHTSMLYERRLGMLMGDNMSQHAAVRKLQELTSGLESSKVGHAARNTAQMTNMLNWIQRMDVATTTALWVACKEQARMDNLKPGTTEYWDRVTKLYERTLRETQPMYDTLHRSAAQKSDKGLRPYLFPFRTVPAQNHGQIVNALEEMRAAKGTARQKEARRYFAKTIIANTESAIMFSALSFLAAALKHKTGRYRDKDDEMSAESAITGILMDSAGVWASNLMPMVGSELFNAIQKIVDKYVLEKKTGNYDAFSVGVVELLNDLIKSGETLIDDGMNWIKSGEAPELKDFAKHLWTAAKSIAKTAGIPAQTMEAYVKGIVANVQDALNGRFPALNNESVDRTNTVNANRYYNALMNGDTEKAAAVLEEMRANSAGTKKEVNQKVRADIAARAKEAYKSGEIDLDGYLDFLADTGLWEPDALKGKTTETIKGLYNDGEISEDEAISLLVDKNGFDEDDAWFKVQEWEDKAAAVQEALDAGLDADEAEPVSGSDYRRIYDAIDANQDIDQLVDELVEHGRQRDAILDAAKDHIVEDYEAGKYTDRQLKELLARHCRITKTDEVNKILNNAKCFRETGHRLSNVRESVINGSLTRDEAQKILTTYGGDDIATAKNKARAYDFARQHPDLDWNVDTVTKYYDAKPDTGRVKKTPYGAGISVETYNTFLANAKGLTKKQEYIDAIAATPGLTDDQKELLLRLKYDLPKESDENKKYDIPWHK